MSTLRRSALTLGVLAVVLPGGLAFLDALSSYQYTLAHPDKRLCGTPIMAVFIVGLAFSIVVALLAAFLSYFAARKIERTGVAPKREAILLAMGPIWFTVLTFLINLSFSLLLKK